VAEFAAGAGGFAVKVEVGVGTARTSEDSGEVADEI
jgi:hypothetical protein